MGTIKLKISSLIIQIKSLKLSYVVLLAPIFGFAVMLPVSQMQCFCDTSHEKERSSPGSRAVAPKLVVPEYCYVSTEPHVYRQRSFENGVLWNIFGLKVRK
jgi:hypothetical protein